MKTQKEQIPPIEKPIRGSGKPKPPTTPWPSSLKRIFAIIAVIFSFGFLKWFFAVAGTLKLAMMYSLANNGKLSGRADGNVYMRNGRIRGMKIPSLVRNIYTTFIRYNFTFLSQAYSSLTQSQRNAWIAFVYIHSDRFANEIRVKGKQAFIGVNQNIINAGDPAAIYPTLAPIPFIGVLTPVFANFSAAVGAGTITIQYPIAYGALSATTTIIAFTTRNESPGINRPGKSAFRIIQALQTGDFTISGGFYQANLNAAFTAKYGPLVAGRKLFLSALPVNNTTGQNATAQIFDTIVIP